MKGKGDFDLQIQQHFTKNNCDKNVLGIISRYSGKIIYDDPWDDPKYIAITIVLSEMYIETTSKSSNDIELLAIL